MDTAPSTTRVIRIDSRYRHQSHDVVKRKPVQVQEEESVEDEGEPLLVREHRGRAVMGKAHRQFHRRAAQVTANVLTVNVEVVATLDSAGNVVGKVTATPAVGGTSLIPPAVVPTVVSAAAVVLPSVPSVPAVPPFPTDLNVPSVPAYPWPSGVPTAAAVDTTTSSAAPASTSAASLSSGGTFSSASSGFNNSTTSIASSSSSSSSSSPSSSRNSTSSRSSSTSSSSSASHSTKTSSTQSSITSSATSAQTTSLSWIASSTARGGGAGGFADPAGTGAAPTPTVAPATDAGSSGPLETPQVVGTVVGSLAGFALLLWLMLFLIKRHKQKQRGGALQLTGDDQTDRSIGQSITQPMAQNPARTSFVPPSFLNRFSGASRSTVDTASTGEKSFQRISGRKLPSAFSEGMTSEQFAPGRPEGTMSGSSFYHDDKGWYGGPGVISKDFGDSSFAKEIGETSNTGAMGTAARVRPSPAHTPTIHVASDDAPVWGAPPRNGGDTLSPPMTPNPDYPRRGSLGRSHPSRDGSTISRSSRFTENV